MEKIRHFLKNGIMIFSFILFGCTQEARDEMVYHFPGEKWDFGYRTKNNKCSFDMIGDCVLFEFLVSDAPKIERMTIDGVTLSDLLINGIEEKETHYYSGCADVDASLIEGRNVVSFHIVNYSCDLRYSVLVEEAPLFFQPVRISILFRTEAFINI